MAGQVLNVPGAIRTFTGKLVTPLAMKLDDFSIVDIAVGLSRAARFRGHTRDDASVTEHSLQVARRCPPSLQLAGLLHNAAEAYLGDIASPLKHLAVFEGFRQAEDRLLDGLFTALGLAYPWPAAISDVDRQVLGLEMAQLQCLGNPVMDASFLHFTRGQPGGVVCYPEKQITSLFLMVFAGLCRGQPLAPAACRSSAPPTSSCCAMATCRWARPGCPATGTFWQRQPCLKRIDVGRNFPLAISF